MSLAKLSRSVVLDGVPLQVDFPCQITKIKSGVTRNAKPFLDLEVTDGTTTERFKVWEDNPGYTTMQQAKDKDTVELSGALSRNNYGLILENIQFRFLNKEEVARLFAGSTERLQAIEQDWHDLTDAIGDITDPRLRLLCQSFLREYGDRFRRAAAARYHHHARRGGLIEHTTQMMRAGVALSQVYTNLNWDLIYAGILFHDAGKIWELDYQPQGFSCPLTVMGELLGHISVGIELVNRMWRTLDQRPEFTQPSSPPNDQVRLHLLHLIASHHGKKEFGAPVTPRTPEGWMLHHIDNVDAYQEMAQAVYLEKSQPVPGIYEARPPLEGKAVAPLPRWQETSHNTNGHFTPPPIAAKDEDEEELDN